MSSIEHFIFCRGMQQKGWSNQSIVKLFWTMCGTHIPRGFPCGAHGTRGWYTWSRFFELGVSSINRKEWSISHRPAFPSVRCHESKKCLTLRNTARFAFGILCPFGYHVGGIAAGFYLEAQHN